jgi:GGDEF domain-containing protein
MSKQLPTLPVPPSAPTAQPGLAALQAEMGKLERRDWWLWGVAIIVMLLLTFAVFAMSFPGLIKIEDPFFQASVNRAVRGLAGLVLIFNAYTVYQQITVKRLRRDFSLKIAEMRVLQARAEEFERLAQIDSLTGLPNRRVAEERLAFEAARSERYGHPLTVIAFDLDKFKEINDTYGHLAGDLVLKEFLVLLPECDTDDVQILLDRLRPMHAESGSMKIPIVFSAGWVGYEKGETTEKFLERADRTLYLEKRSAKTRAQEKIPAPQPVT